MPLLMDPALEKNVAEIQSDLSTFRAATLYTHLPFSDTETSWNGIGISAIGEPEKYYLRQFPPFFERVTHLPTPKSATVTESQRKLGDFDLQLFTRPEEGGTITGFPLKRCFIWEQYLLPTSRGLWIS